MWDKFLTEGLPIETNINNIMASLESRNITTDRTIRVQTNKIFIAKNKINEPTLIYPLFSDKYEDNLLLFEQLTKKQTKLLTSRLKGYYIPKILTIKTPSKTLRDTKIIKKLSIIRPLARKHKVGILINNRSALSDSFS